MTGGPAALIREAMRLDAQGRVSEAIAVYERVLANHPNLPDCWYNLAVLLRKSRAFPAALACYQQALERGVTEPEQVHLNRSVIYTDCLGDHAAAERELQRAIALNPSYTPALLNFGNLCEDLGRREEAIAAYQRVLALDPGCFEALARRANLIPPGEMAPIAIGHLTKALADPAISMSERASLGFALGRILDATGAYQAAFAAYEAANRASRASAGGRFARYDRASHREFIDRLIANGIPAARAAKRESIEPRPIFICGMFRSGSTLTEQLLLDSPGVASAGELDFLPRLVAGELAPFPESLASLSGEQLAGIAARYRAELARVGAGAAHVIDKRPDNFLYIGLIKRLFPDALIVHTRRDPLDNCLSIYFLHLDQQLSYALDLLDIGHYYREYRRLMAHWQREFGPDIIDFDYDTLVREPDASLLRLSKSLDLDWAAPSPATSAAGAAVKTASVWQVREPLYRRSSGRARHYKTQLTELADYLADLEPTAKS